MRERLFIIASWSNLPSTKFQANITAQDKMFPNFLHRCTDLVLPIHMSVSSKPSEASTLLMLFITSGPFPLLGIPRSILPSLSQGLLRLVIVLKFISMVHGPLLRENLRGFSLFPIRIFLGILTLGDRVDPLFPNLLTLVGNAVPPLLAQTVFESVIATLKKTDAGDMVDVIELD